MIALSSRVELFEELDTVCFESSMLMDEIGLESDLRLLLINHIGSFRELGFGSIRKTSLSAIHTLKKIKELELDNVKLYKLIDKIIFLNSVIMVFAAIEKKHANNTLLKKFLEKHKLNTGYIIKDSLIYLTAPQKNHNELPKTIENSDQAELIDQILFRYEVKFSRRYITKLEAISSLNSIAQYYNYINTVERTIKTSFDIGHHEILIRFIVMALIANIRASIHFYSKVKNIPKQQDFLNLLAKIYKYWSILELPIIEVKIDNNSIVFGLSTISSSTGQSYDDPQREVFLEN
jgi:hypothetical protein